MHEDKDFDSRFYTWVTYCEHSWLCLVPAILRLNPLKSTRERQASDSFHWTVVLLSEFSRVGFAALRVAGRGGSALHGDGERGGQSEAPRPGYQLHAEERSQATVARVAERSVAFECLAMRNHCRRCLSPGANLMRKCSFGSKGIFFFFILHSLAIIASGALEDKPLNLPAWLKRGSDDPSDRISCRLARLACQLSLDQTIICWSRPALFPVQRVELDAVNGPRSLSRPETGGAPPQSTLIPVEFRQLSTLLQRFLVWPKWLCIWDLFCEEQDAVHEGL